MRGRFHTWTRVRINLQHVPEALRPPQEALDPDDDPWSPENPETVIALSKGLLANDCSLPCTRRTGAGRPRPAYPVRKIVAAHTLAARAGARPGCASATDVRRNYCRW